MKPKNENLVAGRLGESLPARDRTAPRGSGHSAQHGDGSYGYERLGITCDAVEVAGPPHTAEPSSRAYVAGPEDDPQTAVDQQPPGDPWAHGGDARSERQTLLDRLHLLTAIRLPSDWLTKHKAKAAMIAGGVLAAVMLIAVFLAWGKGAYGPASPQAAEATPTAEQTPAQPATPRHVTPRPDPAKGSDTKAWDILSPKDHPVSPPPPSQEALSVSAGEQPASVPQEKPSQVRYRSCPPGYALNGIVRTSNGLLANVNGKFVSAGGVVGEATVVEVRDYSVEMELNGERFLVGMGGGLAAPSEPQAADQQDPSVAADADQAAQPQQ